jgi:hypothetical protein
LWSTTLLRIFKEKIMELLLENGTKVTLNVPKLEKFEIKREWNGFGFHPLYPNWDDDTQEDVMVKWFTDNGGKFGYVTMEHDNDELNDQWCNGELTSCLAWTPTPPTEESILLSIHDTDSGPIAAYLIPFTQSED